MIDRILIILGACLMVFNIVQYWRFMAASSHLLESNRKLMAWRNAALGFLVFFLIGYTIAATSETDLILALVFLFGSIYVLVSLSLLMMFVSTQREILSSAVIEAADTEAATGMFNLNGFSRHASEIIRANPSKSYMIVQWDIDNFKIYNDLNGYLSGDELLAKIGMNSQKMIGKGLVFGHLNSDHFVILAENSPQAAEEISQDIDRMLRLINEGDCLTSHMGICAVRDPGDSIADLCNHALIALRTIKGQYEEHYAWYREDMRSQIIEESRIAAEMENALEEGQFQVWFQPQVNYATGKISGAEALVRWIHPEKGMIPPGVFIPLFERNGFITRMDQYVWERVCAFQRNWIDSGHEPYPLSVNISRRDIFSCDIVQVITSLVQKYRIAPELLHLEITESAYISSPEQINSMMKSLQENGFTVEIDDFGSGYSSLNTLKDLKFNTLKMDMKFLERSENESRSGRIISSMIRMADWLDVNIIAEGVETKAQADFLKSMGCSMMQGYYFFRPMSENDYWQILLKPDAADFRRHEERTFRSGALDFMDSSAQTTLIFNSFTGTALIVDYHGGIMEMLRVNDRFIKMFHEQAEVFEVFRHDLFERFEPDQQAVLREAADRAAREDVESECVLRMVPARAEQGARWLSLRMRAISHKGQSTILYVAVTDVTAHRQLEELERRMEMIFRNMPAGIATFDLDDVGNIRFQYISDYCYRLFRLEPGSGRSCRLSGTDFGITPAMTRELLQDSGNAVHSFEELVCRKSDGSSFWLRTIMILREEMGQKTVYALLSDITERYEQNSQLYAIMKAIPGGFIRYSCDEREEVSYISEGFLEMLEITREEFSEKYHDRFSPIVYEEDRERVLGEIDEQIERNGESDMCKYRIRTKSGQLRWVYDAAFVTADSAGRRWFNVVVLDLNRQTDNEKWLS